MSVDSTGFVVMTEEPGGCRWCHVHATDWMQESSDFRISLAAPQWSIMLEL